MTMQFKIYKEPELKDPYMVTGLPGVGYVAKLSADYLIKELKAELFEEFYSSSFPPYVLIKKDGTVELLKNELYYWKDDKLKNDLIIFTGNTQAISPEGQYEISNEVLNRAEKFKVKKLFATAAYVTGRHVEKPKVYGVATEQELVEELKKYEVLPMDAGSISGTNGLLFGLAKLRKIQSICLLSETPGYMTPSGRVLTDVKSAQALLEVLSKMLDIKIDMKPLEKEAKMAEEFVQKMEELERRWAEEMRRSVTPPPKDIYI
ncbi:MAG: proteasome assembly chaperone family protein [archaeon]|nr:proteasome assembly chaperone family protein [archaeon]MCP8314947.1 proteasome assembly chaperone family protein [archaeon]MCP8317811.1 proteasome assembly chaperone family protein [archaeon]MCP8322262.1 proteasome assembly chaperone family protein [archaeon]